MDQRRPTTDLARSLARRAAHLAAAVTARRFYRLRRDAGGMLAPTVYRELYRSARAAPDLDIVEVGGAAGAGSIALAWGMIESAKGSKLIVVEKCEGGSRAAHGSYEENLARIRAHFAAFHVAERIRLFPRELTLENGGEVLGLIETGQIGGLVHDADGHIDRDFRLFWPRLVPGGLIVVDDVDLRIKYRPISAAYPQGGTKNRLTWRLLERFTDWGLFEPRRRIGATVFGIKPEGADFARFDAAACDAIHAEIRAEHAAYVAGGTHRPNPG